MIRTLALLLASSGLSWGITAQQYVDQKFGVMFNMGISTFCCAGNEISGTIPGASVFNPTALNIDQWLDNATLAGARYVMLTTKYHMGFALWPTAVAVSGHSPYGVAQTSWYSSNGNYDIVGNFSTKARARGLNVVLYFSIWDRQYEALSGTTAFSNSAAYITMIEAQLHELLTNYGTIDAIWTDGWGWNDSVGKYANIPYATIHDYIKSLQPNCLLIENSHTHPTITSEIETYELGNEPAITAGNTRLSEANYATQCGTPPPDYNWVSGDPQCPPYRMAGQWFNANNNSASFLLGVGVDTTGKVPIDQINNLKEIVAYHSAFSVGKSATVSSTDTADGTQAAALTDGNYEVPTGAIGSLFPFLWAPGVGTAGEYAEVDLGTIKRLTKVEAFNRRDCCEGGLRDLVITAYDAAHTLTYTSSTLNPSNSEGSGCSSGPAILGVDLSPSNITGRYVRVTHSTADTCGFAMGELSVRASNPIPATGSTMSGSVVSSGAILQ